MTGTGEDKLLRSDYYYDLPEELIAQDPLDKRDSSRLLVLDRSDGSVSHEIFTDVADHLVPGDVLVLNDTRVIPARLLGTKEGTGSAAEILLLKNNGNDIWECLVKPGKKLREHAVVSFGEGKLTGEIVEVLPSGNRLVAFRYNGIWEEVLDSLGEMPLPPYITHKLKDRERYQTVYSRYEGSAAAPTAGLHFTEALLDEIRNKGIQTVFVTLHVGLGTFRPVKEENIKDHLMHTEWYEISEESADIINQIKDEKSGRIICVGTTSCRTLESAAIPDENGTFHVRSGSRETDIFIYPGYDFKITEGLITNFHLPESTLIMLVSALGGYENVMRAYREAVEKRYRFFSFGDAMMII